LKLIYFSFLDILERPGYKNKIHSQVKAFCKLDLDSQLFTLEGNHIAIYSFDGKNKEDIYLSDNRLLKRKNIFDEFFLFIKFVKKFKEYVLNENPSIVYIRRVVPITPILINLITWLKKRNIYVVYEYPTYPWKKELLVSRKFLFYLLDSLQYKLIFNKINQLVCFGKYTDKSHSKVVETMNGIEVSRYKIIEKQKYNNEINIIAVAHIMPQHGYDKLIKGLINYYNQSYISKKIYINIVGPQMKGLNLEKIALNTNAENKVKFWGFQSGSALDEIFKDADIGVDCLALNRVESNNLVGSLKSREYLARGLPLIFSGNLDFVKRNNLSKDFLIEVSENTDSIDFNYIIEQYDEIKSTASQIREFADNHLSWEKMMQPVVEKYLKRNND
jgi:hypothetical protein